MMRQLALSLMLLLGCRSATAQTQTQPWHNTTHATLFGVGGANHLDTYLSPLDYTGPQVSVIHETLCPTHWAQGRISAQSIWQINGSITENASQTGKMMGGNVSYDHAWHYNWRLPLGQANTSPALRIMAGPQMGGRLGLLYNTRNGNNPAQAQAAIHLAASAAAILQFRLWGCPLTARNQADIPLLGIMFSPQYGQSYYEIFSEGNTDHNIVATSPFNSPSLRNMLTLDIPIGNITLRTGYLLEVHQSHVNNIKHHSYIHAFMLGWVKHFTLRKQKNLSTQGFIL